MPDERATSLSIISCPHCGKPVAWIEASMWKPFCSERCQLIDLGDWLSEKHAITGTTEPALQDEDAAE